MPKPEQPETSPFKHGEADDSPGFLLWKLIALWQARLAGIFEEFSITQTQYAIMASLLWFEQRHKPPTQAALVGHARIDKMTLSKAIRKLEDRHLVDRAPSSTDTRALQVRFTPAGRELIHRAIIAVESADDEVFAHLDEQQLQTWKALAIALIAGNTSSSVPL
ncbi:MAG: MarR family winged helix-turn-helix transcriptional regulator [Hyphomicrobiales bacterium]|nr:MarR family winged helix-turn-helix transcriptional regulator [Hyphomicrobiales bacterium]